MADCDLPHTCPDCGTLMHRIPHVSAVNWGGLPPHEADRRSPAIQRYLRDAPDRQAAYIDRKE